MKTQVEITDMIYQYLNGTDFANPSKGGLSGAIYQLQRPEGSDKEDLVIGTLSLDMETVQLGVFNLNLHVPNIKVKVNGREQSQPNRARMRVLSKLLQDAISELYIETCSAYITMIAEIKEPNLDEWYVNHRLEVRFHEIDNN